MQKFMVTEDITIEALGPKEAETPVAYIVFGHEIKPLVAALVEAAVWLASQVKGGDHD